MTYIYHRTASHRVVHYICCFTRVYCRLLCCNCGKGPEHHSVRTFSRSIASQDKIDDTTEKLGLYLVKPNQSKLKAWIVKYLKFAPTAVTAETADYARM